MSALDLDPRAGRAGHLECGCGPDGAEAGARTATGLLSLAFGLAVLSQTLIVVALPVAGATLAPKTILAGLPFALTLIGAASASIPASFLLDRMGRRAAFSLGASLGVAGGVLACWAIILQQFPLLCVGAVWLGMAQGFAFFYRHAAAAGGQRAGQAVTVLAGGCVAALAAPLIALAAKQALGPNSDAGLLLVAALLSIAALPLVLLLPHRFAGEMVAPSVRVKNSRAAFWFATAAGAAAWFVMARTMTAAPSALVDCGVGAAGVAGLVSWHHLAMYAPFALAALWPALAPTAFVFAMGAALLVMSQGIGAAQASAIGSSLLMAGAGWACIQIGAARLLHGGAAPSRMALGVHDGLVLFAAFLGSLAAFA